MGTLILRSTKTTPVVYFDPGSRLFIIAGHSLPENAPEFYTRLTSWLDEHLPAMNEGARWEFRLPYFNTSSTKGLYQVLLRVKRSMDQGRGHTIVWEVNEDDEFMREAGENFSDLLGLPIEFRETSDDAALREHRRLAEQVDQLADGA